MALTKAFYESVNSGNVRRVRIMMKDSLLVDPSFKEFKEMESASSLMQGLYDEHDGYEFITDKEQWDNEYMNKLKVQVIRNFSHERLEHLKEVVHYLYPAASSEKTRVSSRRSEVKSAETPEKNKKLSYEEQKRLDQKEGRYLGSKIMTGAVIGAVVGSAVALAADAAVIGGAAAGAAVGGVVTYVVANGGH